jgi:Skp family chaperone for outer membrane proteins
MEFTTWERVQLIAIVGGITGSAAQIRLAGKVLDVLEFTQADAAAVGLVQTDNQLAQVDALKAEQDALRQKFKAGEIELARVWTKVEQIRAKQAAKPKHSPLPATPGAL